MTKVNQRQILNLSSQPIEVWACWDTARRLFVPAWEVTTVSLPPGCDTVRVEQFGAVYATAKPKTRVERCKSGSAIFCTGGSGPIPLAPDDYPSVCFHNTHSTAAQVVLENGNRHNVKSDERVCLGGLRLEVHYRAPLGGRGTLSGVKEVERSGQWVKSSEIQLTPTA